jgi:hypothetical protein
MGLHGLLQEQLYLLVVEISKKEYVAECYWLRETLKAPELFGDNRTYLQWQGQSCDLNEDTVNRINNIAVRIILMTL